MATTKNPMAVGDGNLNSFPFTFPYLKTKDIKVELFHSTGGRKELDSTKFSMANATTISLSAIDSATDWQMASGAPKQGITGNIYRETSSDQLLATFYPGSAIRSEDLNNNYTQNLYATKESSEDATDALDNSRVLVNGVYKSAIDRATEAETTADLADGKADTAIDTADDAKDATDALVGVYNTTTNQWETRGHDDSANGDPESGVGKALDDALEAKNIAIAADDIADDALEATDTLVGKKVNNVWETRGHGTISDPEEGVGKALDDSAQALATANTAQNTYAIPAKDAADIAQDATDTLVATKSGSTWTLQGGGTTAQDGSDPKGVKYAVNQVDDWIINGDGTTVGSDGNTHQGVPYAVDLSTDAVNDSTLALNNSRRSDGTNPPVYTSAISIAEDAYDNAVRQSSDPNWSPSGGTESAIRIAEAAEATSAAAEATANTASANATAAQNAVTNAELFTPYATKSEIPDNNVSSIAIADEGEGYTSTPAVTIGVEWAAATAYSLNDEVFNGSSIYLVTTAGTSAASGGPTGTGSSIVDGGVTWEYKGPRATATAVVTDEKVTSITVTNTGNHYTGTPTVTIAAPPAATPPATATQATATAVMGPLDEDKAEVADSTGLETFTPLTGKPAGFILGDDGLTVKLKYNASTPTWEWVNYYSNDPETRYRKKIIIENKINIDEDYAVGVGNNGFSVGPVTINGASTNPTVPERTLTIPENSTYLVI